MPRASRQSSLTWVSPPNSRRTRRSAWSRVKQNGVDDGEDRGVGADAERECKQRDASEAGVLAETAETVANILPKSFEEVNATRLAAVFLDLGVAAEFEANAA